MLYTEAAMGVSLSSSADKMTEQYKQALHMMGNIFVYRLLIILNLIKCD